MSETLPRDLVLSRRILVFCGSGGVGKTTVAAATALWAALAGRRVIVVTIDPARRLANALGLTQMESGEVRVELRELSPLPVQGRLHAMMLETKSVMDELIQRYAPTPESAERILGQKIYQAVSDSMVGAEEVVALGKLYELYFKRDYDLIVVDTAPTKHAVDFFETPSRLIHLFDMEVLGWFLRPVERVTSLSLGLFRRSTALLKDLVEKAFGIRVLSDIADFLASFQDLAAGFRERSERMLGVLQDPEKTGFLLVTSPQRLAIAETLYIAQKLASLRLSLGYTVVNRVVMMPGVESLAVLAGEEERRRIEKQLEELDLDLESLVQVTRLTAAMAQHDRANVGFLRDRLPQRETPLVWVPFFSTEICDLEGLHLLGRELYGS